MIQLTVRILLALILLPAAKLFGNTTTGILTIQRDGENITLSCPIAYYTYGLEYSTNLNATNWTALDQGSRVGDNLVSTQDASAEARYYRLATPPAPACGTRTEPALRPGEHIRIWRSDPEAPVLQVADYATRIPFSNSSEFEPPTLIDASGFYDPFACSESQNLQYHWVLRTAGFLVGPGYTAAGITGYHSSQLHIEHDALLSQSYDFNLDITSIPSGLTTSVVVRLSVRESDLTLPMYDTCQQTNAACDSCACTFSVALPATEAP